MGFAVALFILSKKGQKSQLHFTTRVFIYC